MSVTKDHRVALLLGGNLGDVKKLMLKATALLEKKVGKVLKTSAYYGSRAWGMPAGTPDFINQVVILNTRLSAEALLDEMLTIEQELGRERKGGETYQSRPIDIDLLLYGEEVVNTSQLQVPHPKLPQRKFALLPLAEVAADWRHPLLGRSVAELLEDTEDDLGVWQL